MLNTAATLVALLIAAVLACYFAPTMVAGARRHRRFRSIALLNAFLGATVIGWLAALVWALAPSRKTA